MVGDVCTVVVTSVTVGLVVLTDTVVDIWADVVHSWEVVVSTDETLVPFYLLCIHYALSLVHLLGT